MYQAGALHGEGVGQCAREVVQAVGRKRGKPECLRQRYPVRLSQVDADGIDLTVQHIVPDLAVAAVVDADDGYVNLLLYRSDQFLDGEHQRAVSQQAEYWELRCGDLGTDSGG